MSVTRQLLCSCLFALGCAQGGGDLIDSGSPPPPMDAGSTDSGTVMGVDAGDTMGVDAGDMGVDAGDTMGVDAGTTMGTDAGDMGVDAGPMGTDAGPPPGCTTAADCSDGLACNGAERCIGGTCSAGTPFTCDDALSCTRDSCVEGATPTCNFVADDSLCPAGQTCGGSGCMASCADTPCRLVAPQCGCPGGQGCYLSGATRLCAAAGSTPAGSTCSGISSCAPGAICINVAQSGTAANMCSRFCDTDAQCSGGICVHTLSDGAGGSIPGVTVCSTPCNPVSGTGCPAGTMCNIFSETAGAMRTFSDCTAPVGTGGQFASCTGSSDCRAGYGCVGTPGECLQWCTGIGSIGSAAGCSAGLRCYGFTTPIRIGGTEYGVCDL